MKEKPRNLRYSRAVLLIVALLLPTLSLIPLGGLWLWQQGYIVYWAIAILHRGDRPLLSADAA